MYINADQSLSWVGLFATSVIFDGEQTVENTAQPGFVDTFVAHCSLEGDVLDVHRLGAYAPTTDPWVPLTAEPYTRDASDQLYRWVSEANTLLKYAEDGTLLLARVLDVQGSVRIRSVAIGPDGSIWMCGFYDGDGAVLEGTPLITTGTNGYTDALMLKLSATGELLWTRQYTDIFGDYFTRVVVDDLGHASALGSVSTTTGQLRVFVVKYAPDGEVLSEGELKPWDGIQNSPYGTILAHHIALAPDGGNVWMLGSYKYRLYYDDTFQFTTTENNYRMFLAQFGTCAVDTPQIDLAAPAYCPGESVTLTASSAESYRWSTGVTGSSIEVDQAGSYHVFAIEGTECHARSADVFVAAYGVPEPTITLGDQMLSCAVDEVAYQWVDCATGQPIEGATAQTFVPAFDGSYAVWITTEEGCEAQSECAFYSTVGITDQETEQDVFLWPNPATDHVFVRTEGPLERVEVWSVTGACVLHTKGPRVDLHGLARGCYTVRVITRSAMRSARIQVH